MSLTPPTINRQPVGLLDFFGLKNGGKYPQQLASTLAPTIDLLRLYEADVEEFISDGVSVEAGTAIGNFNFGGATNRPGIVPQNELWHVLEYSIVLPVPANVNMMMVAPTIEIQRSSPTVTGAGRGSVQIGNPVQSPIANAANPAHTLRVYARDFWMSPNSQLGGSTLWLDPVATSIPAVHNCRFVRFRRS